MLDEIRIYNRALSEEEIKSYFNSTVPINLPITVPQGSKLIVSDENDYHSPVALNNDGLTVLAWKDIEVNQLWLDLRAETDINNYQIKVGDTTYTVNLAAGESQRIFFEDVGAGDVTVRIGKIESEPPSLKLEKRSIIGYSTKTITFGDEASTTLQIPVLDITEKVSLNFGKYEKLMPNGETVIATVPAAVESQSLAPTARPITETINIENPGKPVKPNKADFIDPQTGKLDKEAYKAAKAQYKEALRAYKAAKKTYKAAVKAAKLEAKGQVKSLKVEQKAIKKVNKALSKLMKGEKKADKYVTKAEVSLEKATTYRARAEELRNEANRRLQEKSWTMDDLNNILANKPVKSDYSSKEDYAAAKAEYKEAKAIAKLFRKADKYDLKADKLEGKAELYEQKAISITEKTVDRFKTTLESLIAKYTGKADNLRATGEGLLSRAENLTGVDYYKALGKGLYSVELAEGYARGAEIATAVLETYVDMDVNANPDVAASLESVDISNVNVSI